MKYTLLKMTQLILSSMDSDEVNDITSTVESKQVVDIIETAYNEMASDYHWPEHHDFFQLDATSSTTPTLLTRPSNLVSMDWFKYNVKLTADSNDNYDLVREVSHLEFIKRMEAFDVDQSNVSTYNLTRNSQTFPINHLPDKMPSYYMVFSDSEIVCDSIDTDEDTNLQKSKTWCHGQLEQTFTRSNTFVPNIDEATFSTFFNECKATCFADLKQTINPHLERKLRREEIRTQKNKHAIPTTTDNVRNFPNYGRTYR